MDDLLPASSDEEEQPDDGQVTCPNEDTIKEVSRQIMVAQQRLEHFQGPVPHPSILEGYENLVPGSAERILSQAER